ncbi:hypothetical protein KY284_003990 [Solanum tuberosum]|nr:hypothetical protein KY284_003990 [Solanum tuberosum]
MANPMSCTPPIRKIVYVGWMQAYLCHAYQIFKRRGLKDENIVVFMYNDTAKSELKPRPGVIINHLSGSDVYVGVAKE